MSEIPKKQEEEFIQKSGWELGKEVVFDKPLPIDPELGPDPLILYGGAFVRPDHSYGLTHLVLFDPISEQKKDECHEKSCDAPFAVFCLHHE